MADAATADTNAARTSSAKLSTAVFVTQRSRSRQLERRAASSRWPPRLLWLGLHAVALVMLALSGGWPAGGTAWSWVHATLLTLTAALYAGASLRGPGYAELPPDDATSDQLRQAFLHAPGCVHCGAAQYARTKVGPHMRTRVRPRRSPALFGSQHCHECARCVRRMDHHCWWLGNCVGRRNHCNFIAFVLSQTLLLIDTAALAIRAASSDGAPPVLARCAAVTCAALCLLAVVPTATLFCFQVRLARHPATARARSVGARSFAAARRAVRARAARRDDVGEAAARAAQRRGAAAAERAPLRPRPAAEPAHLPRVRGRPRPAGG